MDLNILKEFSGFEWDPGNQSKNWDKHQVSRLECEQVFFNEPLLTLNDIKHSDQEKRMLALGKTNDDRKLFIAFTIRKDKIRVISARNMNKKEQKTYEEA